jgi:DNA-binding winged helix-turn-helix (wHTH) protein/tetratricopeptide (TPR) repeat protein
MALIYRFEDFELNADQLELRRSGTLLKVDALVLRLLRYLAQNAGRLITKDELVDRVWGVRAVADNAITVAIARLRKTLGRSHDGTQHVTTLYGRGYRLECQVTAVEEANNRPSLLARAREPVPPFVGRERITSGLARALGLAREGSGRTCLLIGEAGIGKTRTVDAFAREVANSEVQVTWGYCREAGDTPPLDPWLRILREVRTRAGGGRIGEVIEPSTELAALLIEQPTTPQAPESLVPPTLRGPTRHRTFDSLSRAFAVAAETTPWLFVLEDIHRADAASLEFLAYLSDELRKMRVLIVATTRPSPARRAQAPATPLTRVLGHSQCERFTLERLRHEHVKAYVGTVLEDEDGRLADAVFAKSEGNPFFMAELTRQLLAADEPDPATLSVSAAALDLVWQPIARLDATAREVLSTAAVIGRSFELSRLQAVTHREPSELMASLDEALATDLLIAAPDSMTAFAFGHELLRSVLYDALTPGERRNLHLRVGRALEMGVTAGEAIPASELAYHFHAALPESDPRKTIDYCRAAAAAAGRRFASLDVVRYLRHALEALELIDSASVKLRMNLLYTSALYSRTCDPNESARALNEVLRLARERADPLHLVRSACMLNPHPGYKPLPGAAPALQQALELLDHDAAVLRAPALAALACAAPHCFSATRVRALLAEAVPLARESGNSTSLYTVLIYRLWAIGGPAEPAETAETVHELDRMARENPTQMPVLPLDLSLFRALAAIQDGDGAGALKALERAAARARLLGKGEVSWHIERARVMTRVNAGERTGVLEALATLHRAAEQHCFLGTAPFCAFDRTVVAREFEAAISVDDALRNALEFDSSEPSSIWSMKVRALAAAGLRDEARAMLEAVPAGALADLPCDPHYLGTLGHLARAALLLGARDYISALYPLLARYPDAFAGHLSFLSEGSVSGLLGALAHALGKRTEAIAHLEHGIRMNEHAELPMCAAEARLELANCLFAESHNTRLSRVKTLAREAQTAAQHWGRKRVATEAAKILQLASAH